MNETKPAPSFFDRLHILSSEMVLGALIAILAIGAASASYLSSMSDSDQTKYNVLAMQKLTNANADYLTANQRIGQDYGYFDSFYLNQDKPDISEYYSYNFSEELQAGIQRAAADTNQEADPFDDPYYEAMYASSDQTMAEADKLFKLAEEFNTRGDAFQLVVLIGSMGLAFAAWGALLPEGRKLRLIFSILSIGILIYAIITWLGIPAAPVVP
jgi:hypothetical protein